MRRRKIPDPKEASLREGGTLHPHAASVTDPLFQGSDFFDPRDLLQVKYEMLRKVRVEGASVSVTAAAFGLSRPTYYTAEAVFAERGLLGLLPSKRGPRGGHKLTEEVMAFLEKLRMSTPSLSSIALAQEIRDRFELAIHPRSIERALARRGKKR